MGDYKVKSSRSALADRINSTELPQLNVLSNRKSGVQGGISGTSQQKLSLSDDPTQASSADDLLAAVGGIDDWDNMSDPLSSGGMSESDFLSTLDSFGNELFAIDSMDTDKTQALPAPSFKNLPNLKSSGELPMPKGASATAARANRQAILNDDIDVPSLRSSKGGSSSAGGIKKPVITKAPTASVPSISSIKPAAVAKAAEEAKPAEKIEVQAPSLVSMDESKTEAIDIPDIASLESLSSAIFEESKPEIMEAVEAPKSDIMEAPKPEVIEAPRPEVVEPPMVERIEPPKALAPVAYAEPEVEAEVDAEAEMQALIASMSPAERAEYEAHCRAQERQAIEEARMRQQRLMENYGVSSQAKPKSSPVGVILIFLLIIGLAGGALAYVLTSEAPAETAAPAVEAQESAPVAPKRAIALEKYPVQIEVSNVDRLYINGVATPVTGPFEFVKGHRNSIFAYANGMTPYFKTFSAKETPTEPIQIKLESDTIYAKGRLSFRLTDPGLVGLGLKVELDGVPLGNFPDVQPSVVLGRPHILTISKEGYGKHLHLIWPDDATNTVQIPELVMESVAAAGASCMLKKFPNSTKPYGLSIEFDDQKTSTPIVANVLPGGMIEYHITREQRLPLEVALIPEGYGTVSLDTSLMMDSIGTAVVSFKNVSNRSDLQVCMRRSGEVICPSMHGETEVPSGNDWEIFAITGTIENAQPIKGAQIQKLTSTRKYGFNVDLNARGTLELKQTEYSQIKK